MLHAEHWAGQIDGKGAVPRIDRGIGNTLAGDCPGVVDQDMELAETPQRRRDHLLPGALVGDVLLQKKDLATPGGKTLRQTFARGGIKVGQDDRGLFPQKELCLSRPLTTRTAGNQRHFVRQACHFFTSLTS
jgi:hypothetical protein